MQSADGRLDWRWIASGVGLALAAVAVMTPILGALLDAPTRKSAHLTLVISFLLAMLALGRRRRPTWRRDAGLAGSSKRIVGGWCRGFLFGVATLAAYSALLIALGQREAESLSRLQLGRLTWTFAKYVPLAFLIGVLEDVTFFGLLYVALGRRIVASATFYALTHFIHVDKTADFSPHVWRHGLEAISEMLRSLARTHHRPEEFVGLLVVGVVLTMVRRETGTIWVGMGVHGGWYWVRSVGRKLSDDVAGDHEWLFGTNRFYDGVLGWVIILLTGSWLAFRARQSGGKDEAQDPGRPPGETPRSS